MIIEMADTIFGAAPLPFVEECKIVCNIYASLQSSAIFLFLKLWLSSALGESQ